MTRSVEIKTFDGSWREKKIKDCICLLFKNKKNYFGKLKPQTIACRLEDMRCIVIYLNC